MMGRFLFCFLLLIFGAGSLLRADDNIREVQTRLKAGGFYTGAVNGRYDSATSAAITRYQIRNGLKITGKLDEQTSYALGVSPNEPKEAMPPRFGEDVWRQLREGDQAALEKLIASEEAKKNRKPNKTVVATVNPPPPAAGPPPSDTPKPPAAEYRSERLQDYIAAFVLAGLDPKVGAETEFFADRVDYFGEAGVTREKIQRDLQRYNARWPERSFVLAGPLQVQSVGDRLRVTFPLSYQLRNGSKRATGKVWKTLLLEKTSGNDFQIVAVNERK